MSGHEATASTEIAASPEQVWQALTDPEQIAAYMMGARVATDWEVGSPITWSGEFQGRPYQDKGEVLTYDAPHTLSVTHFSALSGDEDVPANYHTLVYTLTPDGDGTRLELTQDGNDSEEQAEQFSANWQGMLDGLKALVDHDG
jgi:uncharacterized protein YndB with AHSA1/START domain